MPKKVSKPFPIVAEKVIDIAKDTALDNLLQDFPMAIYWIDRKGYFQGCNENELKIHKLSSEKQIIGKHSAKLGTPKTWENSKKVMKENKTQVFEEGYVNPLGQQVYFLDIKKPLCNQKGKIIGLLGIAIDITKRKKIEDELKVAKEQLEIANQAKSSFIQNMEHDLRTPVAGIASLINILESEETELTKKGKLQLLKSSAQQLLRVLGEILEFHRLDDKNLTVVEKKFNLMQVLQNIINLELPAARMHGLYLEAELAKNVPDFIISDDFRIYRILLNLVSNSLKFTQKGGIKILIKVAKKRDTKIVLQMDVVDTGIGISKEKQKIVYETLSKSDSSGEARYIGSGLGLRVVKKFIDDLSGEIEVNSKPDMGTTFTCLIPCKIPLLKAAQKSTSRTSRKISFPTGLENTIHSKYDLNSYKALLVEDTEIARVSGESLLTKEFGCQVDTASDAKTAFLLAQKNNYSIIFTDLVLPDMDGKKLIKILRSQDCRAPIIALTAYGDSMQKECLACGMNDFLTKPLDVTKIEQIFIKWIKGFREISEKISKTSAVQEKEVQEITCSPGIPKINSKILDTKIGLEVATTKELFQILLRTMLKQLNSLPKNLHEAYEKQDFKKMHILAHSLHGACRHCGAMKLLKSVEDLEHATLDDRSITEAYKSGKLALFFKKVLNDIEFLKIEILKIINKE